MGIVSNQAQTIRPATPQRTADIRRIEPTPTIAPVIVWVVETGMPAWVAGNAAQERGHSVTRSKSNWFNVHHWMLL